MLFKATMILEAIFWVIGVWFIVMQIVLPAFRGTPFFPILRRAPRVAEQKLAQATEAAQVTNILEAAKTVRAGEPPAPQPKRKVR